MAKTRLALPFSRLEVPPTPDDHIARVFVDQELGAEGFTYVLESGREGTVHIEDVLEYNQDPDYLRDLLLYRLTLEAQKAVAATSLARREIIRRLGTSPAQLYRLLDQTNYRKSVGQLLRLLQVLDCDVEFVVRVRLLMAAPTQRHQPVQIESEPPCGRFDSTDVTLALVSCAIVGTRVAGAATIRCRGLTGSLLPPGSLSVSLTFSEFRQARPPLLGRGLPRLRSRFAS